MSGARPIAPDLKPQRSEAFQTPPERPKACAGCGGYHGGVNERLECLERKLAEARDDLKWAAIEIGELKTKGRR